MSQAIPSNINPATTSGNQLATILNGFKDAYASGNSGTSRPANLQAGGTWVDTTNDPSSWALKLYTGTTDITLFSLDLAASTISISTTSSILEILKSSDDAVGARLKLKKRRPTGNQTQNNDVVGSMDFYGNRDTDVESIMARIKAVATDNVTASAQGAYIVFEATVDATATMSEMMRLVDSKLGIGTTAPDETLHVTGTGAKVEKSSDDTVGSRVVRKKKRIAGSGQVLSGDFISEDIYSSTDNTGANLEVAKVEIEATENHTSSANGTSWKLRLKNNTTNTYVDKITVNTSGISIPNQLTSTVSTGTAPFVVASTTKVTNLHVDRAALADTVTTNANLTGDITSTGNATTYAGTLPLNKGGTGQTTKVAAFDALSPMTTSGDIIYGGTSGTGTRLPVGTNGNVLTLSGGLPVWAAASSGAIKVATIKDVKAGGSNGGTATGATWNTRVLNTLVDPDSIVTSLTSNQFVLPAGSYLIFGSAPAYAVDDHQTRIRNITDSTSTILGSNAYAAAATDGQTHSMVYGVFTIAGSKTFEFQHYPNTTKATNGFGVVVSSGENETYAQLTIIKLS